MLGSVLEVMAGVCSLQEHWHLQADCEGEGEGTRQFMVRGEEGLK